MRWSIALRQIEEYEILHQFNLLILVSLQNELNRLVSVESVLPENEQVVVTNRVLSFSHGFRRYVFLAFWLFGILIFRHFNFSAFQFFSVLTFGLFIIRPLDFRRFDRDPSIDLSLDRKRHLGVRVQMFSWRILRDVWIRSTGKEQLIYRLSWSCRTQLKCCNPFFFNLWWNGISFFVVIRVQLRRHL